MQASVFPPVVLQIPYLLLNRKEITFVTRILNSDDLLVYMWGKESSKWFCFLYNSFWRSLGSLRALRTCQHDPIGREGTLNPSSDKTSRGSGCICGLRPNFSFAGLIWVETLQVLMWHSLDDPPDPWPQANTPASSAVPCAPKSLAEWPWGKVLSAPLLCAACFVGMKY